jgi:hypothetical protein
VDAAKTIAAVGATQGKWLLNKEMNIVSPKMYPRLCSLPLYVVLVDIITPCNQRGRQYLFGRKIRFLGDLTHFFAQVSLLCSTMGGCVLCLRGKRQKRAD